MNLFYVIFIIFVLIVAYRVYRRHQLMLLMQNRNNQQYVNQTDVTQAEAIIVTTSDCPRLENATIVEAVYYDQDGKETARMPVSVTATSCEV